MGVLIVGLIWVIIRRMTPNASFWVGAKVNAKVLLVFLLIVYLATGLAASNVHSTSAIVPTTWLSPKLTNRETSRKTLQESKSSAFIPAALIPRAPPVF
jgi:ABC-type uncharacterized transport system permease subunit